LTLLGVVFAAVLFIVVVGEWLGLLEALTKRLPWPFWLAVLLAGGYPVFRNVLRAALRRQIIAHTLMTIGVLAAVAVGEWATAAVVVFFMRVGDFVERFTTERARRAVKDLTAMAPQAARVERDGTEVEVPISEVRVGSVVVLRPGEQIPVDGEVESGQATIDQAAITGESMPVEVGPGSKVFAATFNRLGGLRIRATRVGQDTTFGRIIKLVEEAEAHRAEVQRIADRFAGYYLPVVGAVAALTFLIRRDALATAAVLVVACSCSFALATPIALLASIGAAAKRGLLIKGGKYLEALARANVLLLDKTGTLTLGRPQITDIVSLDGASADELLALAASAERYSEHPLAEAVRATARARGLVPQEPEDFEAVPGFGVRAQVNGHTVAVGSRRLLPNEVTAPEAAKLATEGKTLLYVVRDGRPVGLLAAADTLRPEVPKALAELRALGLTEIELLTGDNERTVVSLAHALRVRYRANLLPEDKIAVVKEYQAKGHTVVMVGDGVNDAPALAQAEVGIAMGAAGSDVAIEAGHVALMSEDWSLVPEVFRIAKRTMKVVKLNIGFTAVYNLAGLTLAALGFLPPIVAAAAQSVPDLGILANSSRLLRQK
ncbi:MAG: heavy metal translocating P-type ATPase, partial [Armatimonadota bacterium]